MPQDNLPVDAIGKAPTETPIVETVDKSRDPLTGQPDAKLAQHLGRIGGFIGGGPEKAGNIAYLVIAASFLILVASMAGMAFAERENLVTSYSNLSTLMISLISGALGYLFGSNTNGTK